jgi:hypothetical protein
VRRRSIIIIYLLKESVSFSLPDKEKVRRGGGTGPHVITGEYLNTCVEYHCFGGTHDCEYKYS